MIDYREPQEDAVSFIGLLLTPSRSCITKVWSIILASRCSSATCGDWRSVIFAGPFITPAANTIKFFFLSRYATTRRSASPPRRALRSRLRSVAHRGRSAPVELGREHVADERAGVRETTMLRSPTSACPRNADSGPSCALPSPSPACSKPLASMMGRTSCSDIMAFMRETSWGVKNWPILVFSLRLLWPWFPRHLL
jgi:hypothetical protein